MGKHEEVTMGPEERLRQAARIFAAGAIRAALRVERALPRHDQRLEEPCEQTPTGVLQQAKKVA